MPCTAGGTPVTIDKLLGLVKLGMTHSAMMEVPAPEMSRPRKGATPAATAAVMYSYWQPSMHTTTSGRSIQREVRHLTGILSGQFFTPVQAAAIAAWRLCRPRNPPPNPDVLYLRRVARTRRRRRLRHI